MQFFIYGPNLCKMEFTICKYAHLLFLRYIFRNHILTFWPKQLEAVFELWMLSSSAAMTRTRLAWSTMLSLSSSVIAYWQQIIFILIDWILTGFLKVFCLQSCNIRVHYLNYAAYFLLLKAYSSVFICEQ